MQLHAEVTQAAFDRNPLAIFFVGEDGVVADANPRAVILSGWPLERLVGMPLDGLLPEPVRSAHADRRRRFMEAGLDRPMGTGLDLRLLDRTGREIPVLINLASVVLESGRFVMAVVQQRGDTAAPPG